MISCCGPWFAHTMFLMCQVGLCLHTHTHTPTHTSPIETSYQFVYKYKLLFVYILLLFLEAVNSHKGDKIEVKDFLLHWCFKEFSTVSKQEEHLTISKRIKISSLQNYKLYFFKKIKKVNIFVTHLWTTKAIHKSTRMTTIAQHATTTQIQISEITTKLTQLNKFCLNSRCQ